MPNTKNKFKYGFINQALFYQITPTFAKVKGHIGGLKDKYNAEKSILVSQLVEHKKHLKKLRSSRMVNLKRFQDFLYRHFKDKKML